MGRLISRAALVPLVWLLVMCAGFGTPTVALVLHGGQPARSTTAAQGHSPSVTKGNATTAAASSKAHSNQQPGWSNASCNPKNHYCPTPSPSACADDQTSGSLVSGTLGQPDLGCQQVDPALDQLGFLCPPQPLGTSGGFCVPAAPGIDAPTGAPAPAVPRVAPGLHP